MAERNADVESELFGSRQNRVLSWLLGCDEWEIRRLFAERFPEAQIQPRS